MRNTPVGRRITRVVVAAALALAAAAPGAQAGAATTDELITYTCTWGDVCAIRPDGTGFRTLVTVADLGSAGPVSPDGRSIAFWENVGASYRGHLYVMAADGTGRRAVAPALVTQFDAPTWSPDSTTIAFTQVGTIGIGVVRVDGTGLRTVVGRQALNPTWSPDGTWIAFSSNRSGNDDIWVVHPDGTELTNLTRTPGTAEVQPAWSPDGSRIAYSRSTSRGATAVWSMTSTGTDKRVLVAVPGLLLGAGISWSPDGTRLVLAGRPAALPFAQHLFVVDADGTGLRQLTVDAQTTFNRGPHWGVVRTASSRSPGTPSTD